MADDNKKPFEKIKPGTNSGKIFFTALFFCMALLFIIIGFWKTILVIAFSAVGYFIGSSKDLKADVANMVNKVVPQEKKIEPTEEDKKIFNDMKSSEQVDEKSESSSDQASKEDKKTTAKESKEKPDKASPKKSEETSGDDSAKAKDK
jgi:uncharacterized membrane protein